MKTEKLMVLPTMISTIEKVKDLYVPEPRKTVLQPLLDYVQNKYDMNQGAHLNFICTHNSRRSQLAQIWAQFAANYYHIPTRCYSGGVEVTAFNQRAVNTLERLGFGIEVGNDNNDNKHYSITYSMEYPPVVAFSKLFDDPNNDADQFAAVMVCGHADENCPFIPGTEQRIPVRYEDPKAFDGTPQEAEKYEERTMQIGSEMFYVFSNILKGE